jgi:hypothetical protein
LFYTHRKSSTIDNTVYQQTPSVVLSGNTDTAYQQQQQVASAPPGNQS